MKRGYFVTGTADGAGLAVVAESAKEAKKSVIASGELDAEWIDIRVYWQRHAIVDTLPIGMVQDPFEGLIYGLYSHLEDAPCEGCGHDRTLYGYHGRALCELCIRRLKRPPQKNAIIERLTIEPCTANDLPYRKGGMNATHATRIHRIKMCGKRTNNNQRCGAFTTVYYLDDDVDRAVDLFVQVNAKPLSRLNLHGNSALDAGLPKHLAQKIRAVLLSKKA